VQDGAFRLRYVNGFDKQTRIQPGTAYPITVDLWSTALVFNAGHKIAVYREYSSEELRSQAGCSAGRMQPDFYHGLPAVPARA